MAFEQFQTMTRRGFLAGLGTAAASHILSVPARAADEPIRIGIIGCGGRGSSHLNFLQQLKESGEPVEITAVCDIYRPRREKAAQATQAKAYARHEELLQDPNVDAVLIATPDHWHGHQLLDALDAGKDAYVEKPITHWRQIELTGKIMEKARQTQRIIQTGTQSMSSSIWNQAARMIAHGDIGKPLLVQAGYFRQGDWGERMPIDDENAQPGDDLRWDTFLGDSPQRSFSVSRFFQWRLYWDYAGGPATDLFPHTFTPILMTLGTGFPDAVSASGGRFLYNHGREVPDTFNLNIDFPEGVTVVLMCTLGNDTGLPTIIRGSEATMTFDENNIRLTPQPGVNRPQKVDPIQRKESQLEFWKNFLSCCRNREEPWSPLDLAYPVQIILQMGVLAYREKRVVRFNPEQANFI